MAVNKNADEYANARIGIFFPGYPASLTGQCVSVDKWFLQEMCNIPNPQAARGQAKDFGNNLVSQGLATQVSEANRKPGDLVVWPLDGGGYGHTGVLLSNDRVFEENANLPGRTSQNVPDGQGGYTKVYSSGIDPLYASWRKGSPLFYRINSYIEGEDMIQDTDEDYALWASASIYFRARTDSNKVLQPLTRDEFRTYAVGKTWHDGCLITLLKNNDEASAALGKLQNGVYATLDGWANQIYSLQDVVKADKIQSTTDATTIATLQTEVTHLQNQLDEATKSPVTKPVPPTAPEVPVVPIKRPWYYIFVDLVDSFTSKNK